MRHARTKEIKIIHEGKIAEIKETKDNNYEIGGLAGMKYYHAAPREIMLRIVGEGKIKSSGTGVVYLCKEAVDACKFLIMRGMKEMSVIEIEVEENEITESHDHAEAAFKCKAYMHDGDIELTGNEKVWNYSFNL